MGINTNSNSSSILKYFPTKKVNLEVKFLKSEVWWVDIPKSSTFSIFVKSITNVSSSGYNLFNIPKLTLSKQS